MYDRRAVPLGFFWTAGKLECSACGKQMQRNGRAEQHRYSKACEDAARVRANRLRRQVRAWHACCAHVARVLTLPVACAGGSRVHASRAAAARPRRRRWRRWACGAG
jgi:hypothetical protein